jgi:hypothetical protein
MSNLPTSKSNHAATFGDAIAHLSQAGSTKEQEALRELAWTMLEIWTLPDGYSRTRFANAWLGDQGWQVQIAPQREMWKPDWVAGLAKAAARRGQVELLGTAVETGEFRDAAIWRVPTNAEDVSRFFESHYPVFSLLFPADRSFAVHCVGGEFAVYAGPEAFLREALPPEAIGAHATAATINYVDPELTEADYADFLGPYRLFMIE